MTAEEIYGAVQTGRHRNGTKLRLERLERAMQQQGSRLDRIEERLAEMDAKLDVILTAVEKDPK